MVEGKGPYKLTSSSSPNKVLNVTSGGEISYVPEQDSDDNMWYLVSTQNKMDDNNPGYYIVSEKNGFALDYNSRQGEDVFAVPYRENSIFTVWYITPKSEIYAIDDSGSKKYLWSILDALYVTPDEHLIEHWIAGEPDESPQPRSNHFWYIFWLIVIVLGIFIFMRYRK
jgi:hypothetical protein